MQLLAALGVRLILEEQPTKSKPPRTKSSPW